MTKQGIGFVGVGRMGGRMARRLINDGYQLTVYDTSEAAVAPLVELGAKRADSPAAVASEAQIVFASVPTPPIVEAIALGPKGIDRKSTRLNSSHLGISYAVFCLKK